MVEIVVSEFPVDDRIVGNITLSREEKLNALNLHMLEIMLKQLSLWEKNPEVKMVTIEGSGKAFCAGGDVRQIYENKIESAAKMHPFFKTEYQLNSLIKNYSKPYIAFLDGITMGGGMGISVHGSVKIGTENLIMAMPETAIGLFPDVGGSYFLSRITNNIGKYLGLTGAKINADDALFCNFIDYLVPANQLKEIKTKVSLAKNLTEIKELLHEYSHKKSNQCEIEKNLEFIEQSFCSNKLEEIIANLEQLNNDWSKQVKAELLKKSPISLVMTLELIERGKNKTFSECMQMEYDLVKSFLKNPDLYEGIRSVLVDKDYTPNWHIKNINAISSSMIDEFFQYKNELLFN